MKIVVGVSDAGASDDPAAELVTYSLGSCIGLALYDPVARVGGMLHYQLPASSMDPERARREPAMFADTGVEHVLKLMEARGARRHRAKVKMAGAAQVIDDGGLFSIGKRNHAAVRKVLWQMGLLIDAEDVGGNTPRTLSLSVADGSVRVKTQARTVSL